jgi:hypothetical protein
LMYLISCYTFSIPIVYLCLKDLYLLAEKYELPGLEFICKTHLMDRINYNTINDLYDFAYNNNKLDLMYHIMNYAKLNSINTNFNKFKSFIVNLNKYI